MKHSFLSYPSASLAVFAALSIAAAAHVPYLEESDYTLRSPYAIQDVEKSIAAYSWLSDGRDLDVYTFRIDAPTRLKTEFLVPVCSAYESFYPAVALIGPGLPPPAIPLGGGYGIQVLNWDKAAQPRETFYEPFGGKSYFSGPEFDQQLDQAGTYVLITWDPDRVGGDYVLAVGFREQFALPDLIRALIYTPMIRRHEELHSPCGPSVDGSAD